ncbi:MAG: amino acid ABC transporter substrate-binding protein, partial [Desulfuromonadales bacterium]|nr:amino acid ABC transporter substrate-binding protein [Desulfuromonadales bacterium]
SYRVIKQVGSYKDIYEVNIGEKSPLKLPRGLNSQWNDGGILYGMPMK